MGFSFGFSGWKRGDADRPRICAWCDGAYAHGINERCPMRDKLWTEDLKIIVKVDGHVLVDGRDESLIGKWHKCTNLSTVGCMTEIGPVFICVVCGEQYQAGDTFRSKWLEGIL